MTGIEGELEALLHFLYAAPVGLVRADADGQIELINSYAARLLLPVSAHLGRLDNLFDALAGVAPRLRALVRERTGHGALGPAQPLVLRSPGQLADDALHADLTLHRMEGGQLMAVLLDTTERRRDERALRSGEARLRFALDAGRLGDWDLDLARGAMSVGPGFDACFGTLPGVPWTLDRLLQAVHDDDRDVVAQSFDRALAAAGEWHAEFRVTHPDGAVRWLALHGRPHVEPAARRWLGVVVDVSAPREAEAARSEALRLGERNRQVEQIGALKSRFLADMSHEIRTPMNAIIGLVHLMRRDSPAPLQADRLAKVDRAARHLLRVVDDVLDLAKVEAGKLVLRPEVFSVDELLADAMAMVAPAAHAKGVELVLDTDHVPARLVGDATRLSQALLNLLANAVRFTERGHVRLRAELLATKGAEPRVRFEVLDTGPGIDPAQMARLFQPFEQPGPGGSGGTGLGLVMTRRLAELMDGDAGVESPVGGGSRFWFTARLAWADEPPASVPGLAGRRVLLVDGLDAARDAILEQLRRIGMEADAEATLAAAVARAAVAAAAGRPYHAALVDARATTAGTPAIGALHATLGTQVPVVVMTAGDVAAAAPEPGPTVAKPLTASLLAEVLQRALGGAEAAPSASPDPLDQLEARVRARHGGQRVLVAEDNLVNQMVVDELLGVVGLKAAFADDGADAVERAAAESFDLILMDMQMPVMDGLAAMAKLRERLPNVPPVIALTANAFDGDREACLAAGMVAHLAKPLEPAQLYQLLLQYLPARR